MTYPSSHVPTGGGVCNLVAGVQAVYGRNPLLQPNSLPLGGQSVVTSASYNAAGQMWKQPIKAGSTVIGGWECYFPASGNNGRITGAKDLQSLLTTKGASSWLVDTATNRLHSSTGATYDANGNLTGEKYRYTTDVCGDHVDPILTLARQSGTHPREINGDAGGRMNACDPREGWSRGFQ